MYLPDVSAHLYLQTCKTERGARSADKGDGGDKGSDDEPADERHRPEHRADSPDSRRRTARQEGARGLPHRPGRVFRKGGNTAGREVGHGPRFGLPDGLETRKGARDAQDTQAIPV